MSDIGTLIDSLAAARLLVVGDAMLDRFVYGAVDRISPEAPIPVLRVGREELSIGGAGNVACNAAALGATVHFLSVVGDDAAAVTLRDLVERRLGDCSGLLTDPARLTTAKDRFVAQGQQLLRADRETVQPLPADIADRLVAMFDAQLDRCGIVVLSDYGKGVLSAGMAGRLIAAAAARGRPVLVDPKGTDYGRYRGAAIVTPNRRELAEASRMPVATDAQVEAACLHLMDAFGFGAIVATRSEEGMTVVRRDPVADAPPVATHLPAEAREVFDVSGAGDTVIATLAVAVAAGADPVGAARLANLAAGIVVGKVGTAVVRTEELRSAALRRDLEHAGGKQVGLEQAVDQAARWRRLGLKVGFTNGCFDLLHPGHVSLIAQARAACDRLVVGLNSDASVRRLKGPERPVQDETARALVLASLADVDLVVVFDEDTPLRLIETLRPDVLVKGADYTIDRVVGADTVRGYGGRILLADLVDGQSTTRIVTRLSRPRSG